MKKKKQKEGTRLETGFVSVTGCGRGSLHLEPFGRALGTVRLTKLSARYMPNPPASSNQCPQPVAPLLRLLGPFHFTVPFAIATQGAVSNELRKY